MVHISRYFTGNSYSVDTKLKNFNYNIRYRTYNNFSQKSYVNVECKIGYLRKIQFYIKNFNIESDEYEIVIRADSFGEFSSENFTIKKTEIFKFIYKYTLLFSLYDLDCVFK